MTNSKSEQNRNATLDDVLNAIEQNQETLSEISTWMKISNVEKVQNVLKSTLNEPEKIIMYHLSDGRSSAEINKITGIDDSTISRYQRKWHNLGLMRKLRARGRGNTYARVFDLDDFEIKTPKIIEKQERAKASTPEQSASNGGQST